MRERNGKKLEIAKKTGKSASLISRKAKQGKLVSKNGQIDVNASVKALKAEENMRNPAKADCVDVDAIEKRILDDAAHSGETYAHAQRRKEIALADLRELELAQKSGEVVALSFATGFLATAAKTIANQLLAMPDKLAPLLAASTDVRQCRDMVLTEVREVLTNLPGSIPIPKTT